MGIRHNSDRHRDRPTRDYKPQNPKHSGNVEEINRDDYRIVTARLVIARERSVTVKRQDGQRVTFPRSLLHGGDDLKLEWLPVDVEWTFRLRAWKAEELNLSGVELER